MRRFFAVSLLCFLMPLASCSQEDTNNLTLRPVSPSLNERLDNLALLQAKKLEGVFKAHPVPLQERQQNFSVLRLSQSCAQKRLLVTLDAHLSDETFVVFKNRFLKAQTQCFKDIVDETLVLAGPDKAYEVNLAVRNFDPSFPLMIVPSHVIIDEVNTALPPSKPSPQNKKIKS